MVARRSATGSKLLPCELSDAQLLAIGRLIRACAEIEDLVNLYLCNLAHISEAHATLLLGRMSSSAKVKLAEQFAAARGGEAPEVHRECFDNEHYYEIIRCRNTVAHGILLGKDEEGLIAFQVQETIGVEGTKVFTTANAYEEGAFAAYADQAEWVIPQIEARLKLQASRQNRLSQGLGPHPKASRSDKQIVKG